MNRSLFKGYLLAVSGWIAAVMLFFLIRFIGLESVPQFHDLDLSRIHLDELVWKGIMLGIITGSVFFGLDQVLDRPSIRRRPYGFIILVQTLSPIGPVFLVLLTLAVSEIVMGDTNAGLAGLTSRLFSPNFLTILVYAIVVRFAFSFLTTVDRKFGPGNLWKLIIGTYHHPREEELIFMFLDLKGSTAYAERLGHVRFGELIQDCFIDLSVVVDHRAQVYQYVGDEAILYWEIDDGLINANCLEAYFRFAHRLRDRGAYYHEKYGLSPVFKAGINIGKATVLEVGEIKREISYLGDVLNTAARIQDKCNVYNEELLIPEVLKNRLTTRLSAFDLFEIGEVDLRGREEAIKLFAVHRMPKSSAN